MTPPRLEVGLALHPHRPATASATILSWDPGPSVPDDRRQRLMGPGGPL